jgi:nitrogen fixation protein NifU and related proteins
MNPEVDFPFRQADGYGRNKGVCGDTVEMFLLVSRGRIRRASFRIDGCAATLACAAAVARSVEGKTVQAAWGTTIEHVKQDVNPLPPESEHCAELAVGALYLALSDYRQKQRAPWKKLYGPAAGP